MLLTAGRLIKYDLKELFKKHIALYIVTLLAAFGCWALHVLSEYVPDNGITPVAYPVMIAVYVIVSYPHTSSSCMAYICMQAYIRIYYISC